MGRILRQLVRAGAVVAVLALTWSCTVVSKISSSSDGDPPVPIGSPAPDFSVKSLDGKEVKLSSFHGHPVMIDFWATWCGPCVESLPHTEEIYKQAAGKGLEVMAISDEDPSKVAKFIKDNNYTFPTYVDSTRDANSKHNVQAIPCVVVVDAEGKLVAYLVGADEDEVKQALEKVGIKL